MWTPSYVACTCIAVLPLLGMAFEIAFSPYNMYLAPETFFAYKPLPEFNWSVYPRYTCNAINWEGFPKNSEGFVANILFREAPGTPARIPQVVAFYSARGNRAPGHHLDPCRYDNLAILAHIGQNQEDTLGRIVKLSPRRSNLLTHWREIIPDSNTIEWMDINSDEIRPWHIGYLLSNGEGGGKFWSIDEADQYNGYMTQSLICWNPWYFAHMREDPEVGMGSYNPENDRDDNAGDRLDGYATPADNDGESTGRARGSDDSEEEEEENDKRTVYTSDEDEPIDSTNSRRVYHPPPAEIIRGNPRWVYRPTTRCRGAHPKYVQWRNNRIRDAGDHIRYDPNIYLYKMDYERLIGRGNIIDIELEKQQEEEFRRQQEGVRAAELFYEALASDIDTLQPSDPRNEMFDDIWWWDNPLEFQLESPDPLQALLDRELNNIEEDLRGTSPESRPPIPADLPGKVPKFDPVENIGLEPVPRVRGDEALDFGPMRWAPENQIHDIFSSPPSPGAG
ncbi:hypothetical protein TWF192_000176 [Orbilia oligospora]|uniref:Uncharacterized protein n=1 Tax=Orbilia oligospora TaxID=2813651 RepID=A0A6G1MQA5_ORBOL|nr:hypothetical protein TWF191_006756 [Orbilia oligospora]KAF3265526.1 hypothetical protein TWF192_000176 [Orbilia oligospora]